MDRVEDSKTVRIEAIRLNVRSLDRSIAFYEAGLGFGLERRGGAAARMMLGGERLELVEVPPDAASYPPQQAANDPWFQHFAIKVTDMAAAYARLTRQPEVPISVGGPQQLPPSTGSVIAYKFRDPDGHPLELSFRPGEQPPALDSPVFLTIDHTAVAVSDLQKSLDFWIGSLGFIEAERLLNEGPAQSRLDGLEGAIVDIIVLKPSGGGPHLELLHYRHPVAADRRWHFSPDDVPSTRLRISGTHRSNRDDLAADAARGREKGGSSVLADPDGHLVELSPGLQ